MIERADAAGRLAMRATSDLGHIRQQAEESRKILGQALNAAVPIIDDAGAIQGHLESTVSEAMRMSQNARESITELVASERQNVEADIQRLTPSRTRSAPSWERWCAPPKPRGPAPPRQPWGPRMRVVSSLRSSCRSSRGGACSSAMRAHP